MIDSHDEEHSSFLSKIFNKKNEPASADELVQVIHEASENDVIDEETEEMLQGIFDINRLRVADVMIPANEIVTINVNSTIEEAARVVLESAHSRYPVIGEDKDHILGVLLAKDLIPYTCGFKSTDDDTIRSIIRPPIIVPEVKRVNSMLKEFQQNRFHIAIVVDEFGGVSGLVTIEDVLEVIVGDIDDEYDTEVEEENIKNEESSSNYLVNGATTIEEFDEFFECNLAELAKVDTIAGLVTHFMGRFPEEGESVTIEGFGFKVLEACDRRVRKLEVSVLGVSDEE